MTNRTSLFFIRSNVRESTENDSRQSGRISDGRSPTGQLGFQSGQLENEDLFPPMEPDDILDLPRVRRKILSWRSSFI